MRRLVIGVLLSAAIPALAQAPAGFTVGDIRVEGLQRISEGTIYNYLPVNIGDRLDQRRIQEAIRALFGTGFFSDIEMRRDGASGLPSRVSSCRETRTSRPKTCSSRCAASASRPARLSIARSSRKCAAS